MKWKLSGWAAIAESSHSKERVLKSWPKLRVTRDWEENGRPPLDYSYTVNQLTPGGHQRTREQRKDWLEGVGFVAIIASLVPVAGQE